MALNELDRIWQENGGSVVRLPKGTVLWHGGIIGPKHPMTDEHLLWTTRNEEDKEHYDGQARFFANFKKVEPYRLELVLNTDMECANFKAASLLRFTEIFCDCSHDKMKSMLKKWLEQKGFAGILGINGGADEVVVYNPHQVLGIKNTIRI